MAANYCLQSSVVRQSALYGSVQDALYGQQIFGLKDQTTALKMAEHFVGKWNMESSDKFDEFMKAVGVGTIMAALGNRARPTVYITVEGDTWSLKTETTFKTTNITFQLDKEFDETTADDRKMKTTITLEKNKLIQDQKGPVPSVITRIVEGDKMTVLCEAKGVTATRIYKKCQ